MPDKCFRCGDVIAAGIFCENCREVLKREKFKDHTEAVRDAFGKM